MCGLYFSVGFKAPRSSIDLVRHRGPDALHWHTETVAGKPVSLGFARLKIIDLSDQANQPFQSNDGDYSLLFNGAIYNYIELREELEQAGHHFETSSDTEVLLKAFMQWDSSMLSRLSGMFSFVIFQRSTARIFAARDRFGIKPLYYHQNGENIAFASEIKQLLELPDIGRQLNLEAAFDFLEGGLTDHLPETFFKNIFQLQGGKLIDFTFTEDLQIVHPISWHDRKIARRKLSLSAAATEFKYRFTASVKRHLRADVRVGSCLSGGLDSSAIVCEVASGGDIELNTFTAVFPGETVDEARFAEAVTHHCPTTNANIVRPEIKSLAPTLAKLLWHQDEPFGSMSILVQWEVFAAAQKAQMKVMLDGQGADELLAGYHPGYVYYFMELIAKGRFLRLWRSVRECRSVHGYSVYGQLRLAITKILLASPLRWLLRLWRKLRGRTNPPHWLQADAFADFFESGRADVLHSATRREGEPDIISIASLCKMMTYSISLPSLLRFEDRNSMAHGIEARVPFLDPQLAGFCLELGGQHKFDGSTTKTVLRAAMQGVLPDSILVRSDKIGFAAPESKWLSGYWKEELSQGVEQTLTMFPSLFNKEQTRSDLRKILQGETPYNTKLWRVYILGKWAEVFQIESL